VWLVEAVRGWRLASLRSPAPAAPVGPLQPLIKRWLKVSSSSLAQAFGGEDLSWLLAQPALRSNPASSAGCCGDPWDVSGQVALPLAYPDSHPTTDHAIDLKYLEYNSTSGIAKKMQYSKKIAVNKALCYSFFLREGLMLFFFVLRGRPYAIR
jgi:hypothetical protein